MGLTAIVVGASALLAIGTTRVHEWVVQTDEMLYVKLARHMGVTGSPIPTIHGQHVGFLGVVYPILLAPFYGALDAVDAFSAAHCGQRGPVRERRDSRLPARPARHCRPPARWSSQLLSVSLPWAVNAAFVMSEPAAYPVFLWAVLAVHAAISEPSRPGDALAAVALALAFFTRPQFLFLVAVLPLAAVIAVGPRRALAQHRVLAIAYAVGDPRRRRSSPRSARSTDCSATTASRRPRARSFP